MKPWAWDMRKHRGPALSVAENCSRPVPTQGMEGSRKLHSSPRCFERSPNLLEQVYSILKLPTRRVLITLCRPDQSFGKFCAGAQRIGVERFSQSFQLYEGRMGLAHIAA